MCLSILVISFVSLRHSARFLGLKCGSISWGVFMLFELWGQ
jgi:hypothetical protein